MTSLNFENLCIQSFSQKKMSLEWVQFKIKSVPFPSHTIKQFFVCNNIQLMDKIQDREYVILIKCTPNQMQ